MSRSEGDPLEPTESVARYILNKKHIDRANGVTRVRAEAFIAYKHVELSVQQKEPLKDSEIWDYGRKVRDARTESDKYGRTFVLHGRADIMVKHCIGQSLKVLAAPIKDFNPYHANITDFPAGKEDQKVIALVLAAESKFKECPYDSSQHTN